MKHTLVESQENTIKKIEEIYRDHLKNDLIICIGGDGSISTICNGLMKIPQKKRLPIFPLPSGSGNSLLRDFNILTIDDAITNYMKAEFKMLDILHLEEVNGKFSWYCINVIGMGFVSDVVTYVVNEGKKFGAFSYMLGIVLALGKFKPYKTVIKYNNGEDKFQSDRVFFMTFSNTKYTGGKIMVAPDAKYDDGLMDVIVLHDINRFQFLKGFRKTFKGKHINAKGCKYFQTNNLEISSDPNFILMPDGELDGISPVKVSVIPKQIKFIV